MFSFVFPIIRMLTQRGMMIRLTAEQPVTTNERKKGLAAAGLHIFTPFNPRREPQGFDCKKLHPRC